MRRWLADQSLTVCFLAIFLLSLVGQSVAGFVAYNEEQRSHDEPPITYGRYLVSSDFGGNVMENWQSEFLQFTLIIVATVWLTQRGSTESKKPEEAGPESDADARVGEHAPADAPAWAKLRGWRLRVYENSLGLAMLGIFLAAWFAQSLANRVQFNDEQAAHGEAAVSWFAYLREADFWNRTLQNWQSEFLAVATMAAFSIYLRQRGSPESKPVGAPHAETGSSG
jgi:Domain of unknown function (DUF6766)